MVPTTYNSRGDPPAFVSKADLPIDALELAVKYGYNTYAIE
jgi:hypothetical protein